MLGHVGCRAAVLAAERKALHQTQRISTTGAAMPQVP